MALNRYEGHRYLGVRDTMVVYDLEDAEQTASLEERMERDDLYRRNMIQTFAPDTLPEARNRGFAPVG